MNNTAPFRVLLMSAREQDITPLKAYFDMTTEVQLEICLSPELPAQFHDCAVVIVRDVATLGSDDLARLTAYVQHGGACLALVGDAQPLPPLFGTRPGEQGPVTELRIRFADSTSALARRLPATFMLTNRLLPLHPLDDRSQPLLVASWQGQRLPLALMRAEGDGRTACLSLDHFDVPLVAQITYRLLLELVHRNEPDVLGVAVLGYGPSDAVGYYHGRAVEAVPGLAFRAVCDLNEQRLAQAQHDFPTLRTTTRRQDLLDASDVDIVIIATPPNLHAALAVELLHAGKHVVCEKPLCFNLAEVDTMRDAAIASGRLLTTHQNRRWDADFLAIQQALQTGLIGEAFHLEAFVGGFFHPCDYWHSHASVSGGALYDWGAHYVDSILQLFPGPIASVTSVAHKRVWHDVTNADQERVQIRFADGREAEFMYSEIAAIRKPKWYVLGTEGAIISQWNAIQLREPHRTTFYTEQEVPVTEAPPILTLCRRTPNGALVEQQLPPVMAHDYPFHHNLADHLLTGEPLAVPVEQSARVVAVLAAAARSAAHGGRIEEVTL